MTIDSHANLESKKSSDATPSRCVRLLGAGPIPGASPSPSGRSTCWSALVLFTSEVSFRCMVCHRPVATHVQKNS